MNSYGLFIILMSPFLLSIYHCRDLSFNNIIGQVPQPLLILSSLIFLYGFFAFLGFEEAFIINLANASNFFLARFLGNNSLSGSLPSSIGPALKYLDFSYNQLSGNFPSWASQKLQLNLVANKFMINDSDSNVFPGLECLQRDTDCFVGSPQCELPRLQL